MNTLFRAKIAVPMSIDSRYATKPPSVRQGGGVKERELTSCGVNRGKFLQQTHESESPKSQSNQKKITQIISISDYSNHLSTKIEIYPLRTKLSGAKSGHKKKSETLKRFAL